MSFSPLEPVDRRVETGKDFLQGMKNGAARKEEKTVEVLEESRGRNLSDEELLQAWKREVYGRFDGPITVNISETVEELKENFGKVERALAGRVESARTEQQLYKRLMEDMEEWRDELHSSSYFFDIDERELGYAEGLKIIEAQREAIDSVIEARQDHLQNSDLNFDVLQKNFTLLTDLDLGMSEPISVGLKESDFMLNGIAQRIENVLVHETPLHESTVDQWEAYLKNYGSWDEVLREVHYWSREDWNECCERDFSDIGYEERVQLPERDGSLYGTTGETDLLMLDSGSVMYLELKSSDSDEAFEKAHEQTDNFLYSAADGGLLIQAGNEANFGRKVAGEHYGAMATCNLPAYENMRGDLLKPQLAEKLSEKADQVLGSD